MPRIRVSQRCDQEPTDGTTVTLDLEITFAPGVKVDTEELLETVPDALWVHDHRKRLLPGVALSLKGERLIGTSIKVEKVEQQIDRIWRVNQMPFEKPESWDATDEECSTIIDVSNATETAVEELRELQAGLWDHYEKMRKATGRQVDRSVTPRFQACCDGSPSLRRGSPHHWATVNSVR
jgi:hypothetical protein